MVERHTSCTLWLLPAQRGRQAPNRTLPGPSGMCWAGRGKAAQLASQSSQGRLLGRANTSVGSRQLSRSEPGKEGVLAQGRHGEAAGGKAPTQFGATGAWRMHSGGHRAGPLWTSVAPREPLKVRDSPWEASTARSASRLLRSLSQPEVVVVPTSQMRRLKL